MTTRDRVRRYLNPPREPFTWRDALDRFLWNVGLTLGAALCFLLVRYLT